MQCGKPRTRQYRRGKEEMSNQIATTPVHEAVEALAALREEQGRIMPADIADAVQAYELDEVEAEALVAELDGLVEDEADLDLDLRHDASFTTDSLPRFRLDCLGSDCFIWPESIAALDESQRFWRCRFQSRRHRLERVSRHRFLLFLIFCV